MTCVCALDVANESGALSGVIKNVRSVWKVDCGSSRAKPDCIPMVTIFAMAVWNSLGSNVWGSWLIFFVKEMLAMTKVLAARLTKWSGLLSKCAGRVYV